MTYIYNPEYREKQTDNDFKDLNYSAILLESKAFFDILKSHYNLAENDKILGLGLENNVINVYFQKN